jgi:glyoxylase-like metal-dependent hydrolase (beta-lactamase superfamily II)
MNFPDTMRVLERGWLSSNNVVFIGKHRTAIVDTGYCTHGEQTLALVRHLLDGRPLDAIYNTHLHSDHCGGNRILQSHYPQVRIHVPEAEFARVNDWEQMAPTFAATGQRCEAFRADAPIRPGDEIELGDLRWDALYAPGHHPYSLLLFNRQHGILISADALWEKGFGVVFPALDGWGGFRETRATLDMIDDLQPAVVIPGHGKPFTDVQQALKEAYSRISYLEADPVRNAQNGIKVLLKFLLMERQKIRLTDVPALLAGIPLVTAANRRYMNYGLIHLAHWAITQLRRAGALAVEEQFIVNVEGGR